MIRLFRSCAPALVLFSVIAGVSPPSAEAAQHGSSGAGSAEGTASGTREPAGAQLDTRPASSNPVEDATRDVARYATDASREAAKAAETTLRIVRSAISEAMVAVRRETERARAAAVHAKEAFEESTDPTGPSEVSASPGGTTTNASRRMRADASFARGNALLEARRYSEARARFAEAIALNPEHDRARAMLAWSQYFLGDFRGAIGTFKTALRRQPTWEGLHNGLGWSRLRLERYQLAADAFRDALERNPDYVDALNGLGSVLFEQGNYEAALPWLEKALYGYRHLTGPEPPEVTTLRSKIAWSLYYGEQYREALAMFIRASLAAPSSQPLQAGMGWCYLQLGRQADARAAFRRAEELGPDDEVVREGLRRASL